MRARKRSGSGRLGLQRRRRPRWSARARAGLCPRARGASARSEPSAMPRPSGMTNGGAYGAARCSTAVGQSGRRRGCLAPGALHQPRLADPASPDTAASCGRRPRASARGAPRAAPARLRDLPGARWLNVDPGSVAVLHGSDLTGPVWHSGQSPRQSQHLAAAAQHGRGPARVAVATARAGSRRTRVRSARPTRAG